LSGPLFYRARPAPALCLARTPQQPRVPLAVAPASRWRRRFGWPLPFRSFGALVLNSAAPRVGTFRPRAVEPAAAGRRGARAFSGSASRWRYHHSELPSCRQLARL